MTAPWRCSAASAELPCSSTDGIDVLRAHKPLRVARRTTHRLVVHQDSAVIACPARRSVRGPPSAASKYGACMSWSA